MTPSRGGASEPEKLLEALTVAMALAPGVYARNRMFDFFTKSGAQRARARASILRGIVPHLARACAVTLSSDGASRSPTGEAHVTLKYAIPTMRLSRVVELTRVELATLRLLAARAGAPCLPVDPSDRALVDAALARLLGAGGEAGGLAIVAKDAATAPPAE